MSEHCRPAVSMVAQALCVITNSFDEAVPIEDILTGTVPRLVNLKVMVMPRLPGHPMKNATLGSSVTLATGVGPDVGVEVTVLLEVPVGSAVGVAVDVGGGLADAVAVGDDDAVAVGVGDALGVNVGVDVADGVAVGVPVGVGVGDGVAVGVSLGVAVAVGVAVGVPVGVGVGDGVAVGVSLGVAVAVGVAVGVPVGVGVGDGVAIGVSLGVSVDDGVAVGVPVGIGVGDGVITGVGVAVGVGVEVPWNSYAPTSHGPLAPSSGSGRGSPRWSVVTAHDANGIWSIAGLVDTRAIVCVGPPLSKSPLGSRPIPLVGVITLLPLPWTKLQVESSAMSYPWSMT